MFKTELLYQEVPAISRPSQDYLAAAHVADWSVRAYFAAAFSPNHAIARYDGPVYRSLRRAAVASVREAYGMSDLMANRVLDVMSDHGTYVESNGVLSAVDYVRRNRTSAAYER